MRCSARSQVEFKDGANLRDHYRRGFCSLASAEAVPPSSQVCNHCGLAASMLRCALRLRRACVPVLACVATCACARVGDSMWITTGCSHCVMCASYFSHSALQVWCVPSLSLTCCSMSYLRLTDVTASSNIANCNIPVP